MWRKGNPSPLLVRMMTGAATVENSMEFPQKIKNGTALWLLNSNWGPAACRHPLGKIPKAKIW